jgi:N-hydroxyarylamine O-acetyltransferase
MPVQPFTAPADAGAYFARIGYDGPREATLEVLREVHRLHAQTIAFENLDPFLNRPVKLEPEALMDKLVRDRRGGYCFEHNLLFAQALATLGFKVSGLAARVMWNQPEPVRTPRGHMLLRVETGEGPHIADTGFGGLTLTGPLRLEAGTEQATPHEPFRLLRDGEEWIMQARAGGDWRTLYSFDLLAQVRGDYEIVSYYLSTHESSHFRTGLIAARPGEGRRHALRNGSLAVHHGDGRTERRELESPSEIRQALGDLFGVDAPRGAAADRRFAEILDSPRTE